MAQREQVTEKVLEIAERAAHEKDSRSSTSTWGRGAQPRSPYLYR